MADVVLSAGIRSNLLSLQSTARLLDQTQTRLATGLKVNSAVDDPTAYFTAQGLNQRARDMTALLDAMDQAIQTLNAADEGITSIVKLIENMKATANQALETKTLSSSAVGTLTGLSAGATVGSITGVDSSDSFTIQVGTASAVTVVVGASTTALSAIIADLVSIADVTAYVTSNGALQIEATNGEDLVIADAGGSAADSLGITGTFTNGINRRSYEVDYNALRTQIDELAADASYKGVNLLQSDNDLTVYFNESQTSTLTINSRLVDTSSSGLNVGSVSTDDWTSDTSIRSAISQLDQAINTLRQQASTFGGNLSVVEVRSDFTDQMINTLETGASNLTIADTNEEGANLLALQTRQQLGSVALSLASQADQNVLNLF